MFIKTTPFFDEFRIEILELVVKFSREGELIHSARNQVKVFPWSQGELVIKSFKTPHILNRLIYSFLRGSKARKSFEHSCELEKRGLLVPTPIGYMIESRFGLMNHSYYFCKKFDYDFTFHEISPKELSLNEELLKSFVDFSYSMHQKGVLHLDYSPGNILIRKVNESYEFALVDVNRMRFGEVTFEMGCKSFGRLFFEEDFVMRLSALYAEKCNKSQTDVYKLIKATQDKFKFQKYLKNKLRGRI